MDSRFAGGRAAPGRGFEQRLEASSLEPLVEPLPEPLLAPLCLSRYLNRIAPPRGGKKHIILA
jgi:hypothetical protein